MLNNIAISNFDPVTLVKMSTGGGLGALKFFGHLERALEPLIYDRMSPVTKFWDDWVDVIILGKNQTNKQINKHVSVICLLPKNRKSHIFVDRSLKLLQ